MPGCPCLFVRLSGCPLRCAWCDTTYAYEEGEHRSLDDLLAEILGYGVNLVEITGGEPLAQPRVLELINALCGRGLTVLLETSGACDISPVDQRAHIIMDYKCPSSGMTQRMHLPNLELLAPKDELKLVLAGREDYEHAKELITSRGLTERCQVLMSCVYGPFAFPGIWPAGYCATGCRRACSCRCINTSGRLICAGCKSRDRFMKSKARPAMFKRTGLSDY